MGLRGTLWLGVVALVAVAGAQPVLRPTIKAQRASSSPTLTTTHLCGPHPTPPVVDFDLARYAGVWYKTHMSRGIYELAQRNLSCIRVGLPPAHTDGQGLRVFDVGEDSIKHGQRHHENATIQELAPPGSMLFSLIQRTSWWLPAVPYRVLAVFNASSGSASSATDGNVGMLNTTGAVDIGEKKLRQQQEKTKKQATTRGAEPGAAAAAAGDGYAVSVIATCAEGLVPGVWVMARQGTLPASVPYATITALLARLGYNLAELDMLVVPQGQGAPNNCPWGK